MKRPRVTQLALIAATVCLVMSCVKKESVPDENTDLRSQLIFPLQDEHVHGSTIVALPNGGLLAAWFQGSGERWADDVRIMGSRLMKSDTTWSAPFVMADVDGFPDINPILFMDHEKRLWLMWYPVLANQWETSIPMYRVSDNYSSPGVPAWSWQDILFVKVGDKTERGIQPNDSFVAAIQTQLEAYEVYLKQELLPALPDSSKKILRYEWEKYKDKMDSLSKGKNMVRSGRIKEGTAERDVQIGYPLTRRLGWQTKNKAIYIGKRMIVPLYSDGFDCSLFALSDNGGKTWHYSNPVLGGAGIQPTIAIGKDSLLVAYLRDNGPPPNRMQRTESRDRGETWSIPQDDVLPNPGAGCDVITLSSGEWLMVFNDSEKGRQNLSGAISNDDGKTWQWKRSIENDIRAENGTSSHYPAVVEGSDGLIHVTYSFHRSDVKPGKSIKYTTFPASWILKGSQVPFPNKNVN
ncbi:MAG: exo-alpha-sialidase [Chryseolinea sp.]